MHIFDFHMLFGQKHSKTLFTIFGGRNIHSPAVTDFFLGNKIWQFRPRSCPVIVEGCVKHWPAMHWSRDTLVSRFGAVPFAAGAADFPLELWYDYAQSNTDDVAGLQNTCAAVGCITLGAGNGWNVWTITSFGTLFIFHYIGNNNPNWRTHILQRGRLNHQPVILHLGWTWWNMMTQMFGMSGAEAPTTPTSCWL